MIEGINASDPIFGTQSGGAPRALDKDAFMQLLVAQLSNQDPIDPVDNQDFIAQLAQFSSLEEMQGVNENLVALAMLQEGNALLSQLTNSSSLIGKSVVFTDPASGAVTQGEVGSVKLLEGSVLLRIGGQDVPLASVTEVIGGDDDPDSEG